MPLTPLQQKIIVDRITDYFVNRQQQEINQSPFSSTSQIGLTATNVFGAENTQPYAVSGGIAESQGLTDFLSPTTPQPTYDLLGIETNFHIDESAGGSADPIEEALPEVQEVTLIHDYASVPCEIEAETENEEGLTDDSSVAESAESEGSDEASVSAVISQSAEPVPLVHSEPLLAQTNAQSANQNVQMNQSANQGVPTYQDSLALQQQQAIMQQQAEKQKEASQNFLVRFGSWIQESMFNPVANVMPVSFLKKGVQMLGNAIGGLFKTVGHLFSGNFSEAFKTGWDSLKDAAIIGGIAAGAVLLGKKMNIFGSKSNSADSTDLTSTVGMVAGSMLTQNVVEPMITSTATNLLQSGVQSVAGNAQTPLTTLQQTANIADTSVVQPDANALAFQQFSNQR